MSDMFNIPQYLTHYYRDRPFRTLTELASDEHTAGYFPTLEFPRRAGRRFQSTFYFEQRLRYEAVMYDQFLAREARPGAIDRTLRSSASRKSGRG